MINLGILPNMNRELSRSFTSKEDQNNLIVYEHQGRDLTYTAQCNIAYKFDPMLTPLMRQYCQEYERKYGFKKEDSEQISGQSSNYMMTAEAILIEFFKFFASDFDEN